MDNKLNSIVPNQENEAKLKVNQLPRDIEMTVIDNRNPPVMPISTIDVSDMAVTQQPAVLSNLAYSNSVFSNDLSFKGQTANQNAQNKLRFSILSNAVNRIQNPQPKASRAAVNVLTNNELAMTIADLSVSIKSLKTL